MLNINCTLTIINFDLSPGNFFQRSYYFRRAKFKIDGTGTNEGAETKIKLLKVSTYFKCFKVIVIVSYSHLLLKTMMIITLGKILPKSRGKRPLAPPPDVHDDCEHLTFSLSLSSIGAKLI